MKIKVFLALILTSIFGFLMLSQLNMVEATTITSSGPITSPITSPVTYFAISGKVSIYRFNSILRPAPNVSVKAISTQGSETYTAITDSAGKYVIMAKSAIYNVNASNSLGTKFYPQTIQVDVRTASVSGVNFLGIIRY